MVKMFSNNFAVARIAFANLFYDLAQQAGAEYDRVKDMYFQVAHDQTYMEVPGHDGTRGFGGKCLPKDLDFLIDSLDKENLNSDWFKNIRSLNKKWQEKF
jgi:UDP-glucose 6-dehydrogenase